MNAKNTRSSNIELLRICSMVMILFLHLFNQGKILDSTQPDTVNYYIVWTVEGICFVSVNCYMLISGYFLWDSKFKWSRLIKLYFEIIFYTVILAAVSVGTGLEQLSLKNIVSLLPIVSRKNWYVTVYFGVYLISPLLNAGIRNMPQKALKSLLLIGGILFSVVPTVFFYNDQFNVISGYSIIWFAYLYMCAGYMSKYKVKISGAPKIVTLFLILILPLSKFAVDYLGKTFTVLGPYSNVLYKYNSLPVLLSSLAVFSCFLSIDIKNVQLSKVINCIGKTTFGVFFAHSFFMLRDHLWTGLGSLKFIDSLVLVPYSLLLVIIVFTAFSLFDLLRIKLFEWLRIDKLSVVIGDFLDKKCMLDTLYY